MSESAEVNSQVVWITGLPGSGKSTLAGVLVDRLRDQGRDAIQLDGDRLREALGPVAGGYDAASRKKLALTYARLARMLATECQGRIVVVATVSGFDEVRAWNRESLPGYIEIYLKTSEARRIEQQKDDLYRRNQSGELEQLVGVDVPYEAPQTPDLVLGDAVEGSADQGDELDDWIGRIQVLLEG